MGMKLKDYIKKVLAESEEGSVIEFEVNLNPDVTVSKQETGNKVRFSLRKEYEK